MQSRVQKTPSSSDMKVTTRHQPLFLLRPQARSKTAMEAYHSSLRASRIGSTSSRLSTKRRKLIAVHRGSRRGNFSLTPARWAWQDRVMARSAWARRAAISRTTRWISSIPARLDQVKTTQARGTTRQAKVKDSLSPHLAGSATTSQTKSPISPSGAKTSKFKQV